MIERKMTMTMTSSTSAPASASQEVDLEELRPIWEQFRGVDPRAVRDRLVNEQLTRFLTEESLDHYVDTGEGETVAAIEYLLTQITIHGALQPDEPQTKRSIAHLLNLLPQGDKIRAALEYLYRSG